MIADYTPETAQVKHKGQVIAEVQGLSLEAIASLVRNHLPDLEAIADLFDKNDAGKNLAAQDYVALATPLLTQAPGLVANVIALAGDAPTKAPEIQKWPMSVSLAALIVIFELTFTEVGQVKKVLEMVATLRAGGKGLKKPLTKPGTKAR